MPPLPIRQHPGVSHRTRLATLPQPALWGLRVAVLCVAVLVLGFWAVGTPGFTASEFTVDQDLSKHHVGVLTGVAMIIDKAFSPVGGFVIIAAVCLFLLLRRGSPVNAAAFGGVAAAGWLSSQFFKTIVERQRPNPALLFDPLSPETGSTSFPSGHVALACGLAWAFWFLLRNGRFAKVAAVLALAVPLVVAWSRIYVGVHYPTDVAASLLGSRAGVIFFAGVWNRYQQPLLSRIPLLARLGPLGTDPAPGGSTVNLGPVTTSNHQES